MDNTDLNTAMQAVMEKAKAELPFFVTHVLGLRRMKEERLERLQKQMDPASPLELHVLKQWRRLQEGFMPLGSEWLGGSGSGLGN